MFIGTLNSAVRLGFTIVAMMFAAFLAACSVSGPSIPAGDITGAIPDGERKEARAAPPASTPGKAKVVMLLPLSGPGNVATVARAMKQAGEMALFERPLPEFQLVVKDDKGTPEGAKAAAEEAVKEGAEIILGPLLASSVEAVAPVAANARIPVIAFSNDRRVLRPGVFLLSFMPEQEVERIIGYAVAKGRRSFAAILPDDAYGKVVEQAFTRAVSAAQANVAAIERYGRGTSSGMLDATRKLGEALNNQTDDGNGSADALLMPGEPESLLSLGPLIAYARIDATRIKILGTAGWDSPNIGRDPTFVGAWYPAPDPRGWQSFSEKFAKTFGAPPPRIASVAFDAVGIAMALSGAPRDVRFTTAGITRASGFTGSDGIVRFQADGTAVRALAVHEVQSFGSRIVDQPSSPGLSGAPGPSAAGPDGRPSQVN